MKINKSALVGLALSAISIASHAGFTASLSGPTALRPGYSGTFELIVRYAPMARNDDLGIGISGAVIWSIDQATAYANPGVRFYKDGVEYSETSPIPNGIGFSPSNPSQTAFFSKQFVWTAGDSGTYDMDLFLYAFERVSKNPSAVCLSDPRCPTGSIWGSDDFTNSTHAYFSVEVTPTAPIPEPETFAMMLAGLGLMGTVARRRNKQI